MQKAGSSLKSRAEQSREPGKKKNPAEVTVSSWAEQGCRQVLGSSDVRRGHAHISSKETQALYAVRGLNTTFDLEDTPTKTDIKINHLNPSHSETLCCHLGGPQRGVPDYKSLGYPKTTKHKPPGTLIGAPKLYNND